MGISNSLGSNTFDILLCLGLPWLIKASFLPTSAGHHFVRINSRGLEYSAISLLSTLLLLYTTFAINKFRLDRKANIFFHNICWSVFCLKYASILLCMLALSLIWLLPKCIMPLLLVCSIQLSIWNLLNWSYCTYTFYFLRGISKFSLFDPNS